MYEGVRIKERCALRGRLVVGWAKGNVNEWMAWPRVLRRWTRFFWTRPGRADEPGSTLLQVRLRFSNTRQNTL